MNPTRIVFLTGTLAIAALTIGLALEYQAIGKLDAKNNVLRGQLRKMDELSAENQRLSNPLISTSGERSQSIGVANTNVASTGDQAELARLRGELEQFSQRSNEVATFRADTRATLAALQAAHDAHLTNRTASHNNTSAAGSSFEVLTASYGTDTTNLDVAAELNDRILNGGLKMIANNNMAGDPEYGKVKSLTVIYRSGGKLMTNQFREGDLVNLPPP
jgi:hypothetical protein